MADDWEDCDESLVVVELTGAKDLQLQKADSIQAQILGPNTERPVMMINGCTYAGRYEDSLGTCLIFQEKETSSPASSGFATHQSTSLDLVYQTDKKLVMQPAFLLEKTAGGPDTSDSKGESVDTVVEEGSMDTPADPTS